MPTWPAKTNYATGDVLTAAQMQDIGNALNTLQSAQYAAGKNKIINGDCNINQRGYSSGTASSSYLVDRFVGGHSGGTVNYSVEQFTPGTAPVAGYEAKQYLRFGISGQSAAGDFTNLTQEIEDVRTLANQTVTVSFWAKANSGTPSIAVDMIQKFGSGGSPSANVSTPFGKTAITTSWARYSYTATLASIAGKTIGTTANTSSVRLRIWLSAGSTYNTETTTLGTQTNTFDIWGVQVEAGSTATGFQTATGTIQGELGACQRYYFRQTAGAAGQHFANGNNESTTKGVFVMPFPNIMRIAPTALEQSGTAGDYSIRHQATSTAASVVPAFEAASTYAGVFTITVASGLTAGNGSFARPVNSSAYLGWSAEI